MGRFAEKYGTGAGGEPDTDRTWGQVGKDLAGQILGGYSNVIGSAGTIYGLMSGDMDNPLTRQGERSKEYFEGWKSDELKEMERQRTAKIEAADNGLKKGAVAFWETVKSPSLLSSFVAEQFPMLNVSALTGVGAAGTATKLGASAARAGQMGTAGAISGGATLQAADAGDQAYEQLRQVPQNLWDQNPDYQELINSGISAEEAKDKLALKYTREAAAASGVASVALNYLIPGAKNLEKVLAGGRLPGGAFKNMLTGGLGEATQEGIEEGSGAFLANRATAKVDPDQDLWAGVGEQAGMGVVAGVFGLASGVQSDAEVIDKISGAPDLDTAINEGSKAVDEIKPTQQASPTVPKRPYPVRMPDEPETPAGNKKYTERVVDVQPVPKEIPFEPESYFDLNEQTQMLPISMVVPRDGTAKEASRAPQRMQAARDGVIPKRGAITVQAREDGKYEVIDGNGTLTAIKNYGWQEVPVEIVDMQTEAAPEAGQEAGMEADLEEAFQSNRIAYLNPNDLNLSEDVPQFKAGADEYGVTSPLGEYQEEGASPIIVWRRSDGRMEIISGRHRWRSAVESGTEEIPAYVFDERLGFNADDAMFLDAELNIRDGQGEVSDYARFFRTTEYTEQQAEQRALLARAKGKQGFSIATKATDTLYENHQAGNVSDEAAAALADAFPNDEQFQSAGINEIVNKRTGIKNTVGMLKAVQAVAGEGKASEQADIFGDESAALMDEAKRLSREANKNVSAINKKINAIQGAGKNPQLAKEFGVDVSDPAAVQEAVAKLKQERERWKNWYTDPGMQKTLRSKLSQVGLDTVAGNEPEQDLDEMGTLASKPDTAESENVMTPYSEQDLREREAKKKKAKQQPQEVPEEEFVLAGSDRPVDQAEARGQKNLFDDPLASRPDPAVLQETQAYKNILRAGESDYGRDLFFRNSDGSVYYSLYRNARDKVVLQAFEAGSARTQEISYDSFEQVARLHSHHMSIPVTTEEMNEVFRGRTWLNFEEFDPDNFALTDEQMAAYDRDQAQIAEWGSIYGPNAIRPEFRFTSVSPELRAMRELPQRVTLDDYQRHEDRNFMQVKFLYESDTIYDDAQTLHHEAQRHQSSLVRIGEAIEEKLGVTHINPGVKSIEGLIEKADRKYNGKISRITDAARLGFVIENPAQAEAIISEMENSYQIMDEGWSTNAQGYIDRKVMVRLADGLTGEVQIIPRAMYQAKAKLGGQEAYDEHRRVDTSLERKAELSRFQKDLYGKASARLGDQWVSVSGRSTGRGGAPIDEQIASKASLDMTRPESDSMAASDLNQAEPSVSSSQASLTPNITPGEPVSVTKVTSSTAPIIPQKSRTKESRAASEPVVTVDQVEERLAPTLKKLRAVEDVKILASPSEAGLPDHWKGAYTKGQAYLFTDNLDSLKDAETTLAHELVGHKGVLEMGGKKKNLESVKILMNSNNKEAKSIAAEVRRRNPGVDNENVLAAEYIAVAAERRVKRGPVANMLKKIRAAVRRFLKQLGFNRSFSNTDVDIMLADAERYLASKPDPFNDAGRSVYGSQPDPQEDIDKIAAEKLGLGGVNETFLDKIKSLKETTWKEAWSNFKKWQHSAVFDGLIAIDRAEQATGVGRVAGKFMDSAYVAARLATGVADQVHALLHFGAPAWGEGGNRGVAVHKVGTKGLLEVFSDLGEDLNGWLTWMAGNRALELYEQGREANLTIDEIEKIIMRYNNDPAMLEKFMNAKEEYGKINAAMLDFQEGAGLIRVDERARWESEWYVPFYRRGTEEGGSFLLSPKTKRGLSHQDAAIKRLTGSNLPTNDLLENILVNYTHAIDASMKNNALAKLVDNLYMTEYLSDESTRWQKVRVTKSEIKARLKQYRGQEQKALKDSLEQFLGLEAGTTVQNILKEIDSFPDQGFENMWAAVAPMDKDVIRVQRNGKNEYYRVHEPELLKAIEHIGNKGVDNSVMSAGRWFKSLLTSGVTASPEFMIRNFIRDAAHAWAINPDGFQFGSDSVKGLWKAMKEDESYRQLMFAGASFQGGYIHGTDPQASAKIIRRALRKKGLNDREVKAHMDSLLDTPNKLKDGVGAAWEAYRNVGDKVENANRVATFKASLESGKSMAQAVFEAKDLMDYSLRGNAQALMVLTDLVPFMNARLQGLSKLGRASASDTRQVAWAVGKIVMFSTALAMLNDDDDRYQELPDWDKDAYWHFWVGENHYRLPKPFEIGLLAGTLPERMYHSWLTDNQPPEAMLEAVRHGFWNTMQFNPIPQAALPLIETFANRSFYFDAPIESMSDLNKLPEDRRNAYTSSLMVNIGKMTGYSPKKLQHVWEGYTGTLGGYALSVADMMVRGVTEGEIPRPQPRITDLPVVKSFYRGDQRARNTQYTTDFYDRMSEVSQLYQSIKDEYKYDPEAARRRMAANQEKLKFRPTLTAIQTSLSGMRSAREQVMLSRDLTPSEKRLKLDQIERQMNDLTQRAAKMTEEAF